MVEYPNFSLVSTVFNERKGLDQTIADLQTQSIRPSEVIITDAGSEDGSYESMLEWSRSSELNIKILQDRGCNVARGRNLAIAASNCTLIVSTDFGCRFHPLWLESLIAAFRDPTVTVVGGYFAVAEQEIKSMASRAVYLISDGYRINPSGIVPSSRSIAYYKDLWEKAGGYPESLTLAGDDTYFGKKLLSMGHHIYWVKKPYVYWSRPEQLDGYIRESFRYGRGAGESRDRRNRRNIASNTTEFLIRIVSMALIVSTILQPNLLLRPVFLVALLLSLFGFRSYVRLVLNWLNHKSAKYHIGVLAVALIIFDLLKFHYLKGFLVGLQKQSIGK